MTIENKFSNYKDNFIIIFQDIMNSEMKEVILDTGEIIIGSIENLDKMVKFVNYVSDIPTKLFIRKITKFLLEVKELPYESRKKYIASIDKMQYKDDCIRILQLINQLDDENKSCIIAKLLRNLIEEKIDKSTFFRLCNCVNQALYEDLLYLKENIGSHKIKGNIQLESLEFINLTIHTGITHGYLSGKRDFEQEEYEISALGKLLVLYGLE